MKLLLVGHPFSPIGMGEQLASLSLSLSQCYYEHAIYDIYPSMRDPFDSNRDWLNGKLSNGINDFDIRIFNINGDEIDEVFEELSRRDINWSQAYNVIMPAWELETYPEVWREKINKFDEVWAISNFVKNSISKFFSGTVRHIGQSCERKQGTVYSRKYFGIRDSAKVVLGFFDESSFFSRKNPYALVNVLEKLEQRIPEEDYQFVIKTKNFDKKSSFSTKPHPKLKVISGNLSYDQISSLVSASDVFVSLHRSEGLGRGGAEAILKNRFAVITGYSGVEDYLSHRLVRAVRFKLIECGEGDYPYCNGQRWADPDIDHAVDILVELLTQTDLVSEYRCDYPDTITSIGVGKNAIVAIEEITNLRALGGE